MKAVTVSPAGNIYLGGDSFVSCYDNDLKLFWNLKTPVSCYFTFKLGDTIFASTMEQILVISTDGKIMNEWGPFEDSSYDHFCSVQTGHMWLLQMPEIKWYLFSIKG